MWCRLASGQPPTPTSCHIAWLVLLVHAGPSRAVHVLWAWGRRSYRGRLALLEVGKPVAVLRDRLLCVDLPLRLVRGRHAPIPRPVCPVLVAAHRAPGSLSVCPVCPEYGGGGSSSFSTNAAFATIVDYHLLHLLFLQSSPTCRKSQLPKRHYYSCLVRRREEMLTSTSTIRTRCPRTSSQGGARWKRFLSPRARSPCKLEK